VDDRVTATVLGCVRAVTRVPPGDPGAVLFERPEVLAGAAARASAVDAAVAEFDAVLAVGVGAFAREVVGRGVAGRGEVADGVVERGAGVRVELVQDEGVGDDEWRVRGEAVGDRREVGDGVALDDRDGRPGTPASLNQSATNDSTAATSACASESVTIPRLQTPRA
jgi:hypothetical protein